MIVPGSGVSETLLAETAAEFIGYHYAAACRFSEWLQEKQIAELGLVRPIHVAAYVEEVVFHSPRDDRSDCAKA